MDVASPYCGQKRYNVECICEKNLGKKCFCYLSMIQSNETKKKLKP